MDTLLLGLITGALFGILFQRSGVLRYDVQIGALRLRDMTVFKFMFSGVIVAMVGLYALKSMGMIELSPKAALVGANLVGGVLFGIGWAVLGYCPGTAAGALGEGRWDAFFGLFGMVLGAATYAEIYPHIKDVIAASGDLGEVTLPELLNIEPFMAIPVIVVILLAVLWGFERKGL